MQKHAERFRYSEDNSYSQWSISLGSELVINLSIFNSGIKIWERKVVRKGLVNERLKTECLQQFTSCVKKKKKKKNETKQKAEN